VRPQDIKNTALFTVEGELDDISGAGQTQAAHGLCSAIAESDKLHLEAKGAGHYGIFSGRRWRDVVYPAVRSFILRSQKTMSAQAAAPQAIIAAAVDVAPAEVQVGVPEAVPDNAPAAEATRSATGAAASMQHSDAEHATTTVTAAPKASPTTSRRSSRKG
jgi:poly(3-hydroxybutyrate) depolymerase